MAEAVPEYDIITGRRKHVFPQRADTMYLSSIPNRLRRDVEPRRTNRTDDIDRAQPQRWSEMYTRNMPDLHSTADIKGAQSQTLHRDLNKPKRNLTNDDIPGTKAKPYTFKTTRCVDPNDPSYTLPSVDMKPPTPPRFMRNHIDVSDIEGAGPRAPRVFEPRDSFNTNDIEGAQAGWKPRHKRRSNKKALRNTLSVDDIVKEGFQTTRVVDPLSPQHKIHGMVHRDGPQQKPRALPPGIGQDFNLHTEDIAGAYPGWKAPHHIDGSFKERGRRHFRTTNKTHDIKGAMADSKRNFIYTKRVTNPLKPEYQGLDGFPYDASPPCTPAHDINNPPPVVREKIEQKLAERNDADEEARATLSRSVRGVQNVGTVSTPTVREQPQRRPTPVTGSSDPRDDEIARLRAEISQLRASSRPPRPVSKSGRESSSTLAQAGRDTVKHPVNRLVLKSRDGRPRVMTPSQAAMAQRKQQSARREAIDAVQNLPDM